MKNLLRGLLSLAILSSTVWPVIACSSSKVTENKDQDDEKSILVDEIKSFILNFFYGTKTTEGDETLNDFGVVNFNELGINSITEFRQKIQNKESITDKEIVDLINKYLIESRIPELQKALQKQFKEIFAEDIDDFIKLKDNVTQIKNDSASMKFSEIKKIVNGDSNNNQVGDVITNEILDDMFESIIKLNI